MNTKKNKVSAVKELRMKKSRLKAEEQRHLHELDKHVVYLYENFGPLLLDAGWTAVKAQLPPVVQEILPGGNKPKAIKTSQKQLSAFAQKYPYIDALTDQVVDLVPVIYAGLKPVLISFFLRKAKKHIFK